MALTQQNAEAKATDWSIPQWVKAAITFFTFNAGAMLILLIRSPQKALWGLSTEQTVTISLVFIFCLVFIAIAFWFFPNSTFTLSFYWLIRFLRAQICVFALLGMLCLVAVRASFFSFQGGIPLVNLVILFLMGLLVPPVGSDRSLPACAKRSFTFLEKLIGRINSIPTWVLSSVIALLPILIVCLMLYWELGASPLDYRPYSFWNDETGYWLWVRSFSHVGLNAGYNAPNEFVAPAAFSRYGEGSPFYVYLYGSIARLTGWFPQIPILINFVILTSTILLFIYLSRLDPLQIILTGWVAVITWPILLYLPLTTHETLNQAIGFILAAIFLILLTSRERIKTLTRASFVFLVYLATLIRLSWGLLLIPVLFYSLDGKVFRRALFSVLLGLGLYLSAAWITSYLVPPLNNSIFLNIKDSLIYGPQILIERVVTQFHMMFSYRKLTSNIVVMFQLTAIIGWNIIRLARLIKSRLSVESILQSRTVFDIYNAATLTAAGLLFYLQEGFDRIFTCAILIVCLLQVARKDYRFLATLLVINIAFFYTYIAPETGMRQVLAADFTTEFPERVSLQSKFEKWIVFDSTTQNPWCNTLLIPLNYYDRRLTIIPPGIGISYIQDLKTIKTPFHSKYLLLNQKMYGLLADRLNIRLLDSSPIGDLYYNLDSGCELHP